MKLSVLDQSVWCAGRTPDAAVRDTLALAPVVEGLGYERFWVSEHHSLPTIVGSAPEVLMAAIAARTDRIRIGSAGVMLPHYSALKVAESFRVLDALAPGRIDLGVGRAPGGDARSAHALNPAASGMAEDFPQQILDLQAWLSGAVHQGVSANPRAISPNLGHDPTCDGPTVWVLGSSDYGAQLAAHLGLPYAFAYFFMDGQGVEQALHLYRSLYRPSAAHPQPQATVCVWALAADTDEQARHAALSRDRWRLDRMRGVLGPLQHPDEVAQRGFTAQELALLEPMRQKAFVGSAATVRARLLALASELQLDELVINTWAHDPQVRHRSYALLAHAFALPQPAVAGRAA